MRCSRHWTRDSLAVCSEDHGDTGCSPVSSRGPQQTSINPEAHRRLHTIAVDISWRMLQLLEEQGP